MSPRPATLLALLLACACSSGGDAPDPVKQVLWTIDRLDAIGGYPTEVLGSPRVVDDGEDAFVAFDGVDDGLRVAVHPLAGVREFTAEVIFRPEADGRRKQRFLHLQQDASKDRILFEIRQTDDDRWFLDTYIKSGGEGYSLYAKRLEHPIGPWYHAALVVDGDEMRHYVNGRLEMSRPIEFIPQRAGRTSIGVRINEESWFRGAIRAARFTPRVLSPDRFLSPD